MANNFLQQLEDKILIFDGAMGTSLQTQGLSADDFWGKEGCNEYLVLSKPEAVRKVHAGFLEVGCEVVETDTFGATRIVLAEYDLADKAYELNVKAAQLAQAVARDYSNGGSRPRFVAGSMGPTTKLPSLGHITFDAMAEAFREQARGLIDGGVDVLLIETCQDLLQTKAALAGTFSALEEARQKIPVMVQVTIENTGTMLLGTEIGAALTVLEPYDILSVGLNCATGPREMNDAIRYLGDYCTKMISCLPNAGIPKNVKGQASYLLTPEELAEYLKQYATEYGLNMVGGCCGTTPQHLRRVVEALGNQAPKRRERKPLAAAASIYSSTPLVQEPRPLIVGEEMNTTTRSPKFKELVTQEKYDDILMMAKRLVNEGSHLLDLCVAIVGGNEKHHMEETVKMLATRVSAPLMIDSTEADVIEIALKLIPGKAIVNSINLEDGEKRTSRVLPLVKKFGAAVIALTIDEEGMALTAEKKFAIAQRIFKLATEKYGIAPQNLLFDALTLPISTGQEDYRTAAIETMKAVELIKKNIPGVLTILGVSNVSFGLDIYARRILNSVFLHEAMEHGLDAAIVNWQRIYPLFKISDKEAELARRLIYCDRSQGDPLQNFIQFYQGAEKTIFQVSEKAEAELTLEDRLKNSIINGEKVSTVQGRKVTLEELLDAALKKYKPLDIINLVLLDGMKVVGDLFGARKMQLPSVLDSAQVMKAAVSYLEKFMDKAGSATKGRIVLATVKGDVHDIGKNLVDIILTNNGYRVINLGIKQPSDHIIKSAIEHQVDAIGLSGLLVKSTVEMKYVIEDLQRLNLRLPVLCGGAALTQKYVEEDMRAVYHGPVFYGQDAFAGLRLMEELTDPATHDELVTSGVYRISEAAARTVGMAAAGGNGSDGAAVGASSTGADVSEPVVRSSVSTQATIPTPPFWGKRIVSAAELDLRQIFKYVNPIALFKNQWQIRGLARPEYERLLAEKYIPIREALEEECIRGKYLDPRVVYGYFPCNASGNELLVFEPGNEAVESVRFTFPRQKTNRRLCLSDFFAPLDSGRRDTIGIMLVTMGPHASARAKELFEANEYARYLYLHGLSVETAEALAEFWHKRMREELGIGGDDPPAIHDLFHQKYRGSRYSFGYGACPSLEDQEKIFKLLDPENSIGVRLTSGFQLEPEQSTSALIVHHPEAKYFNT
ncbi:MAG: methionine synthase [Acidobacteriia bacterium]|nr:methionine synthase [Terriglobia bacterium]